uniref:ribonuclease Z n=1 Tax=Caulacanthus ustulatus TaxID=31411 RepID=UPI0027DA991E|nr:ribonuclease Z [Caulacanthus ustulatus]WCH57237.1 ribonuclease Z [Caulacanthus ustulatus]
MMEKKTIKMSQISKIIITDLSTENISGLLGLLSSLSLINRKKVLNIYGIKGLEKYLDFGKKYSQTKFRYNLYFHIFQTGFIAKNKSYYMYSMLNHIKFEFLLFSKEQNGKFYLNYAKKFNLIQGPLYGKLKKGYSLLLPDGFVINGDKFTNKNKKGCKKSLIMYKYCTRNSIEINEESETLQNRLKI